MSILFSKRSRGFIKWVWIIFAVLLILSMIFAFSGSDMLFSSSNHTNIQNTPTDTLDTLPLEFETLDNLENTENGLPEEDPIHSSPSS